MADLWLTVHFYPQLLLRTSGQVDPQTNTGSLITGFLAGCSATLAIIGFIGRGE